MVVPLLSIDGAPAVAPASQDRRRWGIGPIVADRGSQWTLSTGAHRRCWSVAPRPTRPAWTRLASGPEKRGGHDDDAVPPSVGVTTRGDHHGTDQVVSDAVAQPSNCLLYTSP